MINHNHVNLYESKLMSSKVEYSMYDGPYTTTHDMNIPFIVPQFSSRKIIMHLFHLYHLWVDEGVVYDIIIVHDLMVKLSLKSEFGCRVLEWDDTVVFMKELGNFLVQHE